MNDDYKALLGSDADEYTSYSATGMSTSVISARVAYVYNLHGTCLTLDTACSSALVAIHLASQALKTGTCHKMFLSYMSMLTFMCLAIETLETVRSACNSSFFFYPVTNMHVVAAMYMYLASHVLRACIYNYALFDQ